jgi:hypothetical protein
MNLRLSQDGHQRNPEKKKMNPTVVIWILAAVVAVLVGREVGKRLFDVNAKLMAKKRAAQVLAAKLRDNGLKLLPSLLEDFAVGDVEDMVEKIHDVAKLVESGSDAIEKELEQTYENVLARKLATSEGMALIKAKIAEIDGAPAAGPTPTPAPTGASATAPSMVAAPAPAAPAKS